MPDVTAQGAGDRQDDAIRVRPVTPDRWPDVERLFGPRGACGGCWCMAYRLTRSQFDKQKGAANKRALKQIVASGDPAGLIAYVDGEPVGWCALAPREAYPALERSRTLKRVDSAPVWSITCFFVARPFRRKGISIELLRAAISYATTQGAHIVEGYPVEPGKEWPDAFAWSGLSSAFRSVGFVEVLRRSHTRPIMRYVTRRRPRRPALHTD